jgi:hypothetical protein
MKPIIRIDPNVWITQKRYCKLTKQSKQNVNNMIQRGNLETKYIKELELTLVKLPR